MVTVHDVALVIEGLGKVDALGGVRFLDKRLIGKLLKQMSNDILRRVIVADAVFRIRTEGEENARQVLGTLGVFFLGLIVHIGSFVFRLPVICGGVTGIAVGSYSVSSLAAVRLR